MPKDKIVLLIIITIVVIIIRGYMVIYPDMLFDFVSHTSLPDKEQELVAHLVPIIFQAIYWAIVIRVINA